MSNMLHEGKSQQALQKHVEQPIHILNNTEVSDKDKKLNALRIIYEKLSEFFTICKEEEKENFCLFFRNYLLCQLHKWINDEFDECRNFTMDIYFLIEKNLDDTLLDCVLFKNISRDDNFLHICTNRLKEDTNKKIIEDKEEVRLKIVQFFSIIVHRFRNKCADSAPHVLDINPYLEDILTALSVLIRDPFPLIKKNSCQLLCELSFENNPKDFNHLYKSLLKGLLTTLTVRQNDIRELALKCLKKLLCLGSNRDYLDDLAESLKNLCRKKSSNVLLQVVDCIEVWNLQINDLSNSERAKLVFIVLLCANANISPSFNERCYTALKGIASSLEGLASGLSEKRICKESLFPNGTYSETEKSNLHRNEKNVDEGQTFGQKEHCCVHAGEAPRAYFFSRMNNLFYTPSPFNVLCSDIPALFGDIKKELFYEIMNNERNSWNEGKDDFASILTTFLLCTYCDTVHFVRPILSFVYRSLVLFKYVDCPTTPLLVSGISAEEVSSEDATLKNAASQYGYEYDSFLYLTKFVCLIITCGYLMPLSVTLEEGAQLLLGDCNVRNVAESFYKLSNVSSSGVQHGDGSARKNSTSCLTNTNGRACTEYIFSNTNYHKYQRKAYERLCEHRKSDILLEEHADGSGQLDQHLEKRDTDDNMGEKPKGGEPQEVVERDLVYGSANESQKDSAKGSMEESVHYPVDSAPIICENKKIVLMMLSQLLGGYYLRNQLAEIKLDEEDINFILFLISENAKYENVDAFPYMLMILKYLLNIIGQDCKKYSKILFHFFIVLQSDTQFCPQSEVEKLIEQIEHYHHGVKTKSDFYNDEYVHFVQNVSTMININDFNNFKCNIEFLNVLLCNISKEVMMEQSNHLMNFFHTIMNQELRPFMKSEFLLFLNLFCSKNIFPHFLQKNSQQILKNILLPLCTWKSGLNEAQTRKGALHCIRTLFVKNDLHKYVIENNVLIENLVCVLKSSSDDTWNAENREIAIAIYAQIARRISNNNILLDLLNILIKLMEDSSDTIRKLSANGLYSLFLNESLILSDEVCEDVFPTLLLHMDDDSPGVSEMLYRTLFLAKKFNQTIFVKHAKNSCEYTAHAKLYKEELLK
ncbi:conserved Plasmodium protein, unknown function [Plasmodium knowlesi strain H]|uniref:Dynein axonemal assembly factor 5 TPR repeats domain-containing protein n=3 Tax=Plasmodium knowlesi TaxID=5850 RepID=A0A5K1UGM9_PLAKH|nr:conserved Plasmodium protein, unknown function [Plasmodium knowlesi strain H]OTN64874.1 Uncharacterized protein PKNOH_S120128800 [Plasmodium knowlesi]CAA9988151.1 conserved Plasmodium protein, unknown function [Plasmodium knowlesi strain H]SBO20050.1 conserved Plasmodium protein, unknown function [Plasmodium knowlesi strain H]SBO20776.1 conserved Plasmodium protein, unknown function [Plasmodium knowlesi strain H]VVS77625.1 conserved Plasmodium protein, unknown function [Plasmodium knowlesi |eukprot:XP_002259127.1 hypothetical protein, conserved in Plasmodium species [Plasmodium knowlesi strain H]